MNPARLIVFSLVLSLIVFAICFPLCREKSPGILERAELVMGTIVGIKVPVISGEDKEIAELAIKKAFEEIRRVEGVFSVFKADSEISRINALKAGERIKVSGEVFNLIQKAIEYNKKTEGAFDITVKPLVDLWAGALGKQSRMPSDAEIKETLARTGSSDIILDAENKTAAFKKDGMALDMGGIAKGYAADRAVDVLKKAGIKNAIVDSGGDMYCLGRKSRKEQWMVGVRHPRKKGGVFARLRLENMAIDTSGDYEKYFLLNGRRYSHIIDPRTGYPIEDGVVSATVIAPDSARADILATALCVLGAGGLGLIGSMTGVDAMIIVNEKNTLKAGMSAGLKGRYCVIKGQNL